ncbi:MAG: flagellar hook-length control protein FliK [Specibacter sp.]
MLNEQLARPLFALAAAPLGEHVMTINVVPDALGPVTVRAHLAVDGIRIEMMSPSDAGREGLRNILADLRRDLAAGGMAASLSMGSGNGNAGQDHGAGQRSPQVPGNPWNPVARTGDQGQAAHRRPAPSEIPSAANNSLDITV